MSALHDRVVLITGASSGIGRACARAFAREGCRLILAARRGERLAALASELSVPTLRLALDVRDKDAVERNLGTLPGEWAEVEILVNNAGLSRGLEPLDQGDPSGFEEMIDTNLKGVLWVTRALLPGMRARGRGQVINIGSVAGRQVYPGGAVYCATKHALAAVTQGLRLDLNGTGIRVATVDPGMVETEFSLVRFRGDRERADRVYQAFPPLSPEDVAEAVLFCATRPPHVNVSEILLMPTDQASVHLSHKRGRPERG